MGELVVASVLAFVLAWASYAVARWFERHPFILAVLRVLTGGHPRGKHFTDAGWLRRGQKVLTVSGHAPRYWHMPRVHRAGVNLGVVACFLAVVWSVLRFPWQSAVVLVLLCAAGTAQAIRAVVLRQRRKTWLLPFHLAAHELAGHPRAALASSWIKDVQTDKQGAITSVRLELTQGWPADPTHKDRLVSMAATKFGIENAQPTWRLAGPKPQVTLAHSEPPPGEVGYDDVAAAVAKAHANEFVVGIGKAGKIVKASLSLDSPHFGVNMGTGAGKSNLVAFWLVQHLMRGGIALVLDQKQISQPWLYKDADGRYDFLPNIGYCWTPETIHEGLVWLGEELRRREDVARGAITASGDLRGNVGPRLMIVAEELNYAMPELKTLWNENRRPDDEKKSPALKALGKVAFAGRAVKMNLVLVGQMLTAEVTGQKDSSVRENIGVTAMARYGMPGWKAAIGANVPMPPSPSVIGRVQLVSKGSSVQETQTPLGDLLLYRQMALSGIVTLPRHDMPGVVSGTRLEIERPPADLPMSQAEHPALGQPGGLITLKEAADRRVVSCSLAALRKASQRDQTFPKRVGVRGLAAEYEAAELALWSASRGRNA